MTLGVAGGMSGEGGGTLNTRPTFEFLWKFENISSSSSDALVMPYMSFFNRRVMMAMRFDTHVHWSRDMLMRVSTSSQPKNCPDLPLERTHETLGPALISDEGGEVETLPNELSSLLFDTYDLVPKASRVRLAPAESELYSLEQSDDSSKSESPTKN
jgi:hypothetical protein